MKKIKDILKFFIFLSISVLLFILVYKDQDITEIKHILSSEVNYFWIIVSLILGIMSHILRTIRWNILVKSIEGRSSFKNAFLAVIIGYFANLALPRMGEFTRCGVLSKYEKMSFTKLFGTVVLERVIDLIMFILLMAFVGITQMNVVLSFINKNPEIRNAIDTLFGKWVILPIVVGLIIILFASRNLFSKIPYYKKFQKILSEIADGFKSIKNLEHKWPFIFHSIAIWFLYYMMLYVVFFAFDFTSNLSPFVGLVVFSLSTIGMVLPIQGGIGAWHFIVIASLMVYLPDVENIKTLARAFAFLAHGSMNFMLVIAGLISLIALPLLNKNKQKDE